MHLSKRLRMIPEQERCFVTGTVEYINEEWVFFEIETEEAAQLDDLLHEWVEVYLSSKWIKGKLVGDGIISLPDSIHCLIDGDAMRIPKKFSASYEGFLMNLSDQSFLRFVTLLNQLDFSLYDCVYCYDFISYVYKQSNYNGVNFLLFDNTTYVCNVQHFFSHNSNRTDQFEFTVCDGRKANCYHLND